MSSSTPPPGPPPGPPAHDRPYAGEPSSTSPVDTDAAPEAVGYHRLHRTGSWGRHGWWRALVGVLLLVVLMLILVPIVVAVGFWAWFLLSGQDLRTSLESLQAMVDTTDVTPVGLAYLNLTLAGAIPVAWLLTRTLHGLRPRWLASVRPRLRWGWFGVCFGLAFVALLATVVVGTLLPQQSGSGVDMSGSPNAFTSTTRDFVLVILLLTPLQAAGEEYAFRGYLTQALGGLVKGPRVSLVVAVLVPSLLFALAHGAQDAPIFVDRLAFGLVAGVLTIATGGLEAGIAMHVLNNWLAFGLALGFGDMSSALNPSGGTWWSLPVTLTQSLVYTALAVAVARRLGVATRSAGPRARTPGGPSGGGEGVLEGSRGRV